MSACCNHSPLCVKRLNINGQTSLLIRVKSFGDTFPKCFDASALCELWPYCDHNLLCLHLKGDHPSTSTLSKSIYIYIVKITVTPWSDFCLQPVPPCLTIMRWTLRNIKCCQTKREQDYLRLCVFLFFLCNTFSLLSEIHGQILFEAYWWTLLLDTQVSLAPTHVSK